MKVLESDKKAFPGRFLSEPHKKRRFWDTRKGLGGDSGRFAAFLDALGRYFWRSRTSRGTPGVLSEHSGACLGRSSKSLGAPLASRGVPGGSRDRFWTPQGMLWGRFRQASGLPSGSNLFELHNSAMAPLIFQLLDAMELVANTSWLAKLLLVGRTCRNSWMLWNLMPTHHG